MVLVLFSALVFCSRYNFLLFHTFIELLSITVAWSIFVVSWNSRQFLANNYLIFLGISYLFAGVLDLVHTMGYMGMNIFQGYKANMPTQLWVAARYMESISLLIAPVFLRRNLKIDLIFLAYTLATVLVLGSIFYWNVFPACFVDGEGLTAFKIGSEYIISMILLGALALLFKNRREFDQRVFQLLAVSISFTITSELFFTFYIHVYGLSNLAGHCFKIISFYFIYKAIVETGLKSPHSLLSKNLEEKSQNLAIREKAIESSLSGIAITDLSGNLVYANSSFLNMWGYADHEVLEKPISNFWMTKKYIEAVIETLLEKGVWVGELAARRKNRDRFYVEIVSNLVKDDKGDPLCMVGAFKDVTKEKMLQKQLTRSDRLVASGKLAASIAHEINSPLQGITALINTMERTLKGDENLSDDLQLLKGGFERIRDIVKKLLDFNRPDTDLKIPLEINRVIEDTVSLLKSHLTKENVCITLKLSPAVPDITASFQQLGQVFLNLINNAVEAMATEDPRRRKGDIQASRSRDILIESAVKDNDVVIKIHDTGPGIKVEDAEHVFDPFYSRKKKMGLGIGLSICHEIIEDHQGFITADNSPEGGAVFTIRLPAT